MLSLEVVKLRQGTQFATAAPARATVQITRTLLLRNRSYHLAARQCSCNVLQYELSYQGRHPSAVSETASPWELSPGHAVSLPQRQMLLLWDEAESSAEEGHALFKGRCLMTAAHKGPEAERYSVQVPSTGVPTSAGCLLRLFLQRSLQYLHPELATAGSRTSLALSDRRDNTLTSTALKTCQGAEPTLRRPSTSPTFSACNQFAASYQAACKWLISTNRNRISEPPLRTM